MEFLPSYCQGLRLYCERVLCQVPSSEFFEFLKKVFPCEQLLRVIKKSFTFLPPVTSQNLTFLESF